MNISYLNDTVTHPNGLSYPEAIPAKRYAKVREALLQEQLDSLTAHQKKEKQTSELREKVRAQTELIIWKR